MEKFIGEGGQQAIDVSAQFVPLIHEAECKAYKVLTIENPLPIPKIYGYWLVGKANPGVIIMEDLGERAGIIDNIATGLTFNQWRSIVECLADLHAWSLVTKIPWQQEVAGVESLEEFFKSFTKSIPYSIKLSKEKYPESFSHLDEEKILEVSGRTVQYSNTIK